MEVGNFVIMRDSDNQASLVENGKISLVVKGSGNRWVLSGVGPDMVFEFESRRKAMRAFRETAARIMRLNLNSIR